MPSSEPRAVSVRAHLEAALEAAEDGDARYHLREALQKVYLEGASPEPTPIRYREG